jgi:NADP-dependent 3-hydroxy acid dehydrogenase YdfG
VRDLAQKLAVITGAASGVGAALARALHAEGARLALLDVNEADLSPLAEALGAHSVAVDVADASAVEDAARGIYANHDNVHLLINNAGVMPPMGPIWELPDNELRRVLDVNVRGVVNGLRSFVPRLLAQSEAAHIVNTASEAAFASRGFVSGYHASKHAVLAITEGLAEELGFLDAPIRVSVVCPSAINTRLMSDDVELPSAEAQRLWNVYLKSLERGLSPEDVARVVVDGIKEERFYLFPHPEVRDLPAERAQAVADDKYPTFADHLAGLIGRPDSSG